MSQLVPDAVLEPHLKQLIMNKCYGNPLHLQETVCNLFTVSAAYLTVTSSSTKEELDVINMNSSIPEIQSRILDSELFYTRALCIREAGARVDRLSALQQLILKVASLLCTRDAVFELTLLEQACPASEQRHKVQSTCVVLEEKDLLRQYVPESGSKSTVDKSITYKFTSGFVYEIVKSRLLTDQTKKMEELIKKGRELHGRTVRKQVMELMMKKGEVPIPNVEGFVQIRKYVDSSNMVTGKKALKKLKMANQVTSLLSSLLPSSITLFSSILLANPLFSHLFFYPLLSCYISLTLFSLTIFSYSLNQWKKRFLKLGENRILISKEPDDGKVVQIGDLKGALVTKMDESELNAKHCFKVECKTWVKKGVAKPTPRTFYIMAESAKSVEHWMYWIKYVTEFYNYKTGGDASFSSGIKDIASNTASDGTMRSPEVITESMLTVTVLEADKLCKISALSATISNPYVVLTLLDTQYRTSVGSDTIYPKWGEDYRFNVPSIEALLSDALVLKVFDNDIYGTDDCLGQCGLNLLSVWKRELDRRSTHMPDDSDDEEDDCLIIIEAWCNLRFRKPGDISR